MAVVVGSQVRGERNENGRRLRVNDAAGNRHAHAAFLLSFVIHTSEQQMQFLQPLIVECQKDGYIDKNISVHKVVVFCKSAVNSPIVLSEALDRVQKNESKLLPKGKGKFTSDDEIAQRVDMALRGVAVVKERPLYGRQV
jgi:hypothetical protein